jgi:hypothetical protein
MTVTVRPHPMTFVDHPDVIDRLRQRFGERPELRFDLDVATTASLAESQLMISDWSGAALEYAFGLERPVLFIDVPRKVRNPAYAELGIEPIEVSIRERIGRIVSPDHLDAVPAAVVALVDEGPDFVERLRSVRAETVHNVGRSAEVAARVIARTADEYFLRWDESGGAPGAGGAAPSPAPAAIVPPDELTARLAGAPASSAAPSGTPDAHPNAGDEIDGAEIDSAEIDVEKVVAALGRAAGSDPAMLDQATLDELSRQIDVRRGLDARYGPKWVRIDGAGPLPAEVANTVAVILCVAAAREAERGSDESGFGLKALNSVLKLLDQRPDLPDHASIEAWATGLLPTGSAGSAGGSS